MHLSEKKVETLKTMVTQAGKKTLGNTSNHDACCAQNKTEPICYSKQTNYFMYKDVTAIVTFMLMHNYHFIIG